MANNLNSFAGELLATLSSTTNIDAATKQKLRDRFVAAYPGQWTAYLTANSLSDTAANRGKFVVQMTISFWQDVFTAQSRAENTAAIPAPDILQ